MINWDLLIRWIPVIITTITSLVVVSVFVGTTKTILAMLSVRMDKVEVKLDRLMEAHTAARADGRLDILEPKVDRLNELAATTRENDAEIIRIRERLAAIMNEMTGITLKAEIAYRHVVDMRRPHTEPSGTGHES